MAGFLKFLGVLLILGGIVGGVVIGGNANWEQYKRAHEIYQKLPDNQFALAEYQAAGLGFWPSIVTAVTTAGGGVVGGAILLGLGEGLALLGAIAVKAGARAAPVFRTYAEITED